MPKTPRTVQTAVRPLYAVAGATDLAVELARGYVAEAQQRVTGVQKDAQKRAQEVQKRFTSVDLEPKALQARAQSYVTETVNDLNETYTELADRGERFVTRIRRQESTQDAAQAVKTTTARAKATRTSAKKTASTTKSSAKATRTSAKKAAQKSVKAVEDAAEKLGD